METDLTYLPPHLPVPEDDGACYHLSGRQIPAIQLPSTDGTKVSLHYVESLVLLKRVTLVFEDGYLRKYFYPVFPPDKNIDAVLAYLKATTR